MNPGMALSEAVFAKAAELAQGDLAYEIELIKVSTDTITHDGHAFIDALMEGHVELCVDALSEANVHLIQDEHDDPLNLMIWFTRYTIANEFLKDAGLLQ